MSILNDPDPKAKELRLVTYLSIKELEKLESTGYKKPGFFSRSETSDLLTKIISSMSEEEKNMLNTAYLIFLRTEGVQFPPAITYRLLGDAVRWKLKFEFDKHFIST